MNTQKEKMIRMSKILGRILRICAIVLIVLNVPIIVVAVFAPALGLELSRSEMDFLQTVSLSDLSNLRAWLIDVALGTVTMIAILFIAGSIFRNISRDCTPFTKKNSTRIMIISLLIIADEIVIAPLQLLLKMILVPEVEAIVSITLSNMVVAVVVFCLALIFEYGRTLQQESDELL